MDRVIRNGFIRTGLALSLASAALLVAGKSQAADDDKEKVSASTVLGGGGAGATAAPGGNDHDMWVGHMGVGWYGISDVPLGQATTTGDATNYQLVPAGSTTVSAPAIGVRYWLNPQFGIDAALGFSMKSGSTEAQNAGTTTTVDKVSSHAFLIHGGVPIVLGNGQHFSFQITPELNLGISGATYKPATPPGPAPANGLPPNADMSGFLLQLGARVGGEIYFGFMGIPQLALEGSVGLYFQSDNWKVSAGNQSYKDSNTTIATSNIHSPWEIFGSTIAARYYF